MRTGTYRLVVGGGKGGVGKTTVALHLALALTSGGDAPVRYVDGDVEEPDGGIFLRPNIRSALPVHRPIPEIDSTRCDACGRCASACSYGALLFFGGGRVPALQPSLCAGCGACSWICPRGAIREVPVPLGEIRNGEAGGLAFSEGILRVGEARSARLGEALIDSLPGGEIQIVDGPPGAACPVRVLYARADRVLLVSEPTPFGEADLKRGLALARLMGRPAAVFLNRDDGERGIREYLLGEGIPVWGCLPDSPEVGLALARGEILFDVFPGVRARFDALADRVREEAGRS